MQHAHSWNARTSARLESYRGSLVAEVQLTCSYGHLAWRAAFHAVCCSESLPFVRSQQCAVCASGAKSVALVAHRMDRKSHGSEAERCS